VNLRPDSPTTPEMVRWAFHTILGHYVVSDEIVGSHQALFPRFRDLCEGLKNSNEFATSYGPRSGGVLLRTEELALVVEMAIPQLPAEPGWYTDFLGVRTRLSFQPPGHDWLDARFLPIPTAGLIQFHDAQEWGGTLRAAIDARARGRFVAYELGAGWGPWVATVARLAQRLGLEPSLCAVEADAGHLEFIHTHFQDNDLPLESCRLIQAVVGAADGTAWFPAITDSASNYGASASFDATLADAPAGMIPLPCLSLRTLLRDETVVDLIHCDIQGAEADTMAAGIDVLSAKVRRIVIGTHGRGIEERLFHLFTGAGWRLEDDKACRMIPDFQPGDPYSLAADGVQVWRNRNPAV
jgi:FkbM family methyltransferase